jgi:predicted nucleic acid-binding protein
MRIFLDANVLVSVLNKEYPTFSFSSKILSLCDSPKFEVYTSPISLAIAFYFSEKKSGREMAKRKMAVLASKLRICPVNENVVIQTSENKLIGDFEDGLEYYAAKNVRCQCIVTEDLDDFYFSELEVMNCCTFLEKYLA